MKPIPIFIVPFSKYLKSRVKPSRIKMHRCVNISTPGRESIEMIYKILYNYNINVQNFVFYIAKSCVMTNGAQGICMSNEICKMYNHRPPLTNHAAETKIAVPKYLTKGYYRLLGLWMTWRVLSKLESVKNSLIQGTHAIHLATSIFYRTT